MKPLTKSNNLSDISLSVYSFGYSAGFLQDHRIEAKEFQNLKLKDIALIAKDLGLGGIEFPVDKYFSNPLEDGLDKFINEMNSMGIKLIFDLENFSANYLISIKPYLAEYGSKFIRAKVSTFYGGNRYRNSNYLDDLKSFQKNIEDSLDLLKDLKLKILVENHQDIVVNDIYDLLSKYGEEFIGVNWDIGNSLPSGETPNSFLEKLGRHIGNVHLKDYQLFSCTEGYIMSRCELGKGIVDFKEVFKLLNEFGKIPMTIELGAFNSRVADINLPEYWNHTPGVNQKEKENFMNFINQKVIHNGRWETSWEMASSPKLISEIELQEIFNSVAYLKSILND